MPFDGSGTFTRIMNWTADAAAGVKIKADRHDAQDDDIAAGLSQVITKDGQTQVSADIGFNGHRITGVGQPTAPQDAATKKYIDDKFGSGLTISGADELGRIVFSGSQAPLATGKPLGVSFTQADLFFGVKPLDVEAAGKKPRWVWNNKGDGMGTDVAEMDETGILTLKAPLTLNWVSPVLAIKPVSGNGHVWFYAADGVTTRMILYTSSGAQGPGYLTVGGATYTFSETGRLTASQFLSAGVVYSGNGASYLGTDGNIIGPVWANLGYNDAYSAIVNRIESRAAAYMNNCVTSTRMAGAIDVTWVGGAGPFYEYAGYVITGSQRADTNRYLFRYRQPQVHIPNAGWIVAFGF